MLAVQLQQQTQFQIIVTATSSKLNTNFIEIHHLSSFFSSGIGMISMKRSLHPERVFYHSYSLEHKKETRDLTPKNLFQMY